MRYYVSFSAWKAFEHECIFDLVEKVEAGRNILIFGQNSESNNRMLHILERYVTETRDSVTMEDVESEGEIDILKDFVKSMQVLAATTKKVVVNDIIKKEDFELIEVKEGF